MESRSSELMKEFLCGLVAGFTSVTICHPLDVIRTRMNIMVNAVKYRAATSSIQREWTTPPSDPQSERSGEKRVSKVSTEVRSQRHRLFHHCDLDSLLQFHLLPYLSLRQEICERVVEAGKNLSGGAWGSCVWFRLQYTDESNMGMRAITQVMRTRYMVEVFHPPSHQMADLSMVSAYRRMIQAVINK